MLLRLLRPSGHMGSELHYLRFKHLQFRSLVSFCSRNVLLDVSQEFCAGTNGIVKVFEHLAVPIGSAIGFPKCVFQASNLRSHVRDFSHDVSMLLSDFAHVALDAL